MMEPVYFALYRSNEQFHVRFVQGERKEEPYFLYYMFRPDGVWISVTSEDPSLETEDIMAHVDLARIMSDPHHDEPLDAKQELKYQSGTFEIRNDTLFLTWKHNLLEEKQRQWYFRFRNSGELSTDFEEIILELRD